MGKALKVCSKGGCPELVEAGRCDDHTRQARKVSDRARGTASERGYNSAGHKRFRRAVLNRDPICVECSAAGSTVADHYPLSRKELIDQGRDPNDPIAGRGLCKPCHDRSTAVHQPGGWASR